MTLKAILFGTMLVLYLLTFFSELTKEQSSDNRMIGTIVILGAISSLCYIYSH